MESHETQLVMQIIGELEKHHLQYAILRNYENYPRFGNDLDIVMNKADLPKWRKIAVQIASKEGWNTVTECRHWADPIAKHINIEVFRFYIDEPLKMLQVDVFHGFAIFSMPLYKERELLENRITNTQSQFTHIDPTKEMLFKLLQINSLLHNPKNSEKCNRYRELILTFHKKNKEKFETAVSTKFGHHGITALDYLGSRDFDGFGQSIAKGKKYYLYRHFVQNPLEASISLFRRFIGRLRQYYIKPCGTSLTVYAENSHIREKLRTAMRQLLDSQVLYCWTESDSRLLFLDKNASRVMERGGIVVQWTNNSGNCTLAIDDDITTDDIRKYIYNFLVARHKPIHGI